MQASAIIVAGGRGRRFGSSVPKQLHTLRGRTILERSIAAFDVTDAVREIVVVLPADLISPPPECLGRIGTDVRVVAGGDRRQDSVAIGFDAVAPDSDIVIIHDAARPFCTRDLVERTLNAASESGAAIAALVAQDTVKEADALSNHAFVGSTLPRERIFLAQTPQAFRRSILEDAVALGRSGSSGTDESALAEQAGHRVRLVAGEAHNMKITTEDDLALAEGFAAHSEPVGPSFRVGLGYDLHRVVADRPLVLGGVTIPGGPGLLGHSDADVVCHAIADAVLGAANAGDIGRHFPDDDPRWKDASSVDLLAQAGGIVRERGFTVDNVDVVVITDWPRISDHVAVMCHRLAEALEITPDRVAVKGKTSEGVGPVGRGEAIIVHSVALLRQVDPPRE